MQPKIVFLGSGGDSTVVGKQKRASGGIILRVEGYQFHLDPGPGALVKAKEYGINPRENTAILVSHAHINHADDVNSLISAMTYNGLDRKGVVICSDSVLEGTDDVTPVLSSFSYKNVERVIKLRSEQKVGIENVEIHAISTAHSDKTGIGFKIFTPDFTLSYSGDTAYSNEIVDQYKDSDIIILNTVYPKDVKSDINLTLDDTIKIVKRIKPKLCIITHFGNKLIDADPIYEAREIQKETGTQVIAAVDGLEIHPLSYAARSSQKTLNTYSK